VTTPLISVIIPVYNGERYLGEAIESVLAEAYAPLELLVVDDGSSDGSAALAEGYGPRVQCYRQPHRGLAESLNYGMAQSQGMLLAFNDADDVWMPGKLARQTAALAADPTLDMVFGHVQQFISPELADLQPPPRLDREPLKGIHQGAMLIRRAALARTQGFDPTWRVAVTADWYLRALDAGLTYAIQPEVVMRRRVHGSNLTRHERQNYQEYLEILKRSLDRRRASRPDAPR
jgi:glycosyltransferase involved in cell wall biosynthesis